MMSRSLNDVRDNDIAATYSVMTREPSTASKGSQFSDYVEIEPDGYRLLVVPHPAET
jgi:hypothetical protein